MHCKIDSSLVRKSVNHWKDGRLDGSVGQKDRCKHKVVAGQQSQILYKHFKDSAETSFWKGNTTLRSSIRSCPWHICQVICVSIKKAV